MGKKISQISSTESTALSDTDLFEGEESGGTSFQFALSVLKSTLKTYLDTVNDVATGSLLNGKLSVSLSTTDLVVAVKTLADGDPSASDPVRVRIGDAEYTLTAALSVTIPDGGNVFNAGAAEFLTLAVGYFVYLRYNATDGVCIGVSRVPYARLYSDFAANGSDETMTDESGAVWNDITTADAGDVCQNVGYFEAVNAGAAGYEWSAPANVISEPKYETNELSWTPTHSRSGTNYTNFPTTSNASYWVRNTKVLVIERHTQDATPGGTGNQLFTLPFTNAKAYAFPCLSSRSDGVTMTSFVQNAASTAVMVKYDSTTEVTGSSTYILTSEYVIK